MSLKQTIISNLIKVLPPTHFYRLKSVLLRLTGFNIHPTARLVSSVRILGQMPLTIGKDSFIGHEVMIAGSTSQILIGNNVDIAPRVTIVSGTHIIDMEGDHTAGMGISKKVIIGDGAWIGAGSIIIGDVSIGKKSIIGAGSVVVSNIPPFCLAVGNPCKPVKYWNTSNSCWTSSPACSIQSNE